MSGVDRGRATAPGDLSGATSSWSRPAPPTRPSCCCVGQRQAPRRPGQRLGPGRAQLHVPQQRRRCWPSPRSRTRRCSRRPWASTTSTSGCPDFDYPMGNIQMVGKSEGPMYKGEKPIGTSWRRCSPWTMSRRTPSTSGSRPRTCRAPDNRVTLAATATSAQLHPQQPGAQGTALPPAEVDAQPPGHAPAPAPTNRT